MATQTLVPSQRDIAKEAYGNIAGNRWIQLTCGIIAMIVISNYQYAFTLFTPGMKQTFPGVPYAKIAAVFSAFILFETCPMPGAIIYAGPGPRRSDDRAIGNCRHLGRTYRRLGRTFRCPGRTRERLGRT